MPRAHKHRRKAPVTAPTTPSDHTPHPSGSSNRPQATRTTIRRFHVLIKRQAQLQQIIQGGKKDAQATAELARVEQEIEDLGGLAAYQRMSTIGQGKDRGGGSEKVLISWLREMNLHQSVKKAEQRLRLLEVGALKPDNYASCQSWVDVTPIDLHAQHPDILEQDFLLMDPDGHREKWDVISLSLVLNFPPDPKDRGQMLRLAHTMLRPDGLLFIALPLPCILNSRYMTPEHFDGLMQSIGFEQVHTRWKEGGKMAYWLYRRKPRPASTTYHDHLLYEKKTVFRQGNRNNFVILL
ncbi:nucleolus protein [Polyporus arcularius HHB13444]|uniref:25S rRNA adenine-N(1) methyltransferase n=1 Tax=Polyporus arcularius HHB13444 TaxID=1314778 RepID=A0A5C3P5P5_9APHY|nr:nucleolus protein [Polyporus arcularius HHB13444]